MTVRKTRLREVLGFYDHMSDASRTEAKKSDHFIRVKITSYIVVYYFSLISDPNDTPLLRRHKDTWVRLDPPRDIV